MKTMNLREANQQFSKLVREVEETGESVTILRNGKPSVRITAVEPKPLPRTPEQEAALARLLDPKYHIKFPAGWKFSKQEIWDEQINRFASIRDLPDRPGLKKPKYSRNRG
jgi:prevent-host-death family protein